MVDRCSETWWTVNLGQRHGFTDAKMLRDGHILVSGQFFEYNGHFSPGLMRLDPEGNIDFSFSPGSGAQQIEGDDRAARVDSITVDWRGRIYLTGIFDEFNDFGEGSTSTLELTIAPAAGTPVITSALADSGQVGENYSYQIAADGNDDYLAVEFDRRISATDVTIVVEVSSDLKNWSSGGGFTTEVMVNDPDSNDDVETVTVRDNMRITDANHRFIRARFETVSP